MRICWVGAALWATACSPSGTIQATSAGTGSSAGQTSASATSTGSGTAGGTSTSASATESTSSGSTSAASSSSTGGQGSSSSGSSSSGSSTGAAQLTFTIDVAAGPQRQFQAPVAPVAISPYVYGLNSVDVNGQATRWGILRHGGDGFSDWNWVNNYTNAGADYCWNQNPQGGGAKGAAGAVAASADSIPANQVKGIATIVTVPILDFVSGPARTPNRLATAAAKRRSSPMPRWSSATCRTPG